MEYTFVTTEMEEIAPGRYKVRQLVVEAPTWEGAWSQALSRVPQGYRIWTWWENAPLPREEEENENG